jgi:hypothetical protein
LAATRGWKVQSTVGGSSIVLEKDFATSVLSERARQFLIIAMQRLEQSSLAHAVAPSRAGMLFIMVRKPLSLCRSWLNEFIRIHKVEQPVVTFVEMLQWFSIMLVSHSTSYPPVLAMRIIGNEMGERGRLRLMDIDR